MIDNVKKINGLYILKNDVLLHKQAHLASCNSILGASNNFSESRNNEQEIMLWHFCLGHPSFLYLKMLFLSLFMNKNQVFHCEVCQLSKHCQNQYPSQLYKSSHPFAILHNDLWGLVVSIIYSEQNGLSHSLMIVQE